jgi:polysaccharide pyruvyl transferase WcaK-like protein
LQRSKYLKKNKKPEGIIVIGAFDRLDPSINKKTFSQLIISTLKYPLKKIVYNLKLLKFNKHLNNQKTTIKRHSQIVSKPIISHNEGLKLAEEMLEKIASSEILITSRIHAALPALAMGLKVVFIDEGLKHDNHKQRLSGLRNYFTSTNLKDFFMINLDNLINAQADRNHVKKIKLTINKFLNQ